MNASPHIGGLERGDEFFTRERCWILELWNTDSDPAASIARCRVPPGVTTELHSLTVSERYVIVSGAGSMHVGGREPEPVGAGDVVSIPAGVAQRIANIGTEDLLFLAICTPRFVPEAYVPLEGASQTQAGPPE
jgi:mannose-6-phosphate isomerase-like protein (cupin superfamily)